MRVTAQTKHSTRKRILAVAARLFQRRGFNETTTRDIARDARIAVGTLFNYFPTKEAVAMTLVTDSLTGVEDELRDRLVDVDTLQEALFAHVAVELRRLGDRRSYIAHVLERTMRPPGDSVNETQAFRDNHLKIVRDLFSAYLSTSPEAISFITMHLYWTLYLAVLTFWSGDESPNQEDTLALLDQSMRLFAASLNAESGVEVNHGA